MSWLAADRLVIDILLCCGLSRAATTLAVHVAEEHRLETLAPRDATPFQRVMFARRYAWRSALKDPSEEVRVFAADHVLGPNGFAEQCQRAYDKAKGLPERERIRAVYDLLRSDDCLLARGIDTPGLRRGLGRYFAREFMWAPIWSAGWREFLPALVAYIGVVRRRRNRLMAEGRW